MLVLPCVLGTAVRAADATDTPEAINQLAQAGAEQLALRRIDELQPPDAGAPSLQVTSSVTSPKGTSFGASWVEWEMLRLQLLMRLDRNDVVLQRAALWPSAIPAAARAGLHALAARAALSLGRTAVARDHAGRALWTPGLGTADLRELRLLVIRSHVRDGSGDDAYRSMLRFEQDYRPLDAATATGFVDALLDLGRAREAVNWLGLLDERSPAKLRLRLQAGVVTPQGAIKQVLAAQNRSTVPDWWRVLLEAAQRQSDGVLRITALEQLLDVKPLLSRESQAGNGQDADAAALLEAYASHARAAANAHHLLAGDDANWLEFAIRRRSADPVEARAYFAYLARMARDPALRQIAQQHLVADYAKAKLPRTGLRIFELRSGDVAPLAGSVRNGLGGLAEDIGDHQRALHYWQDLPAPDPMSAALWRLRLTAVALRAGRNDIAAEIVRLLTVERADISAAQVPEWLDLASQLGDHGMDDLAQVLFERLLTYADPAQTRRALTGIARTHQARGQPLRAADFYLRAALGAPKEVPLGGAPVADAAATEARMLAGFSLARAGLREDARAQFEWLLKNSRDPAQIAIARRELGFQ